MTTERFFAFLRVKQQEKNKKQTADNSKTTFMDQGNLKTDMSKKKKPQHKIFCSLILPFSTKDNYNQFH